MSLGARIRSLRKTAGYTQKEIADRLDMGSSNFGHIENDRVIPTSKDLDAIAEILHTSTDYLLGRSEQHQPYYELTAKDHKDVAKELERIMSDLESREALAFHGEPLDDEDRELLRRSLENSLLVAKQLAKKKFTPNKYRN